MHSLAIREQTRQLVVTHARPGAHAADIKMHERRSRRGIIANAAALQAHGDLAHTAHRHVDIMHVHRLAEHMLRMFSHCARTATQDGIGMRRTIGRDDVDRLARAALAIGFPNHVKQAWVHRDLVVVAPVAQEAVQLFECRAIILAIDAKGRRNALARVGVVEIDRAGVAVGNGVLRLRRQGRPEDESKQATGGKSGDGTGSNTQTFQLHRFTLLEHWSSAQAEFGNLIVAEKG